MVKPLSWIILALAMSATGCSSTQPERTTDPAEAALTIAGPVLLKSTNRSRVALDLVNTLMQVEGYAPPDGVLDITRLVGPFGASLKRVLAAKGYRSTQQPDSTSTLVQFQLRRAKQSHQTTVILSAGNVRIKRDYQLIDGQVQPASHLFIRGAPADTIEPDDSIFL